MVQVRPWQPGDEDQIRRVVRQVFDEYKFAWDPYGYHKDLYRLDSKYAGFWVAQEQGGTIVGVCGLSCFSPIPGERGSLVEHKGEIRLAGADCEMKRLYVLGRARGKGVGRRLAQAALDFAAERGQTLMEIWSDKLFTEAHGLYKGLGAEVVGERVDSSPDKAEEWGMALPLAPQGRF